MKKEQYVAEQIAQVIDANNITGKDILGVMAVLSLSIAKHFDTDVSKVLHDVDVIASTISLNLNDGK